MWGGGGGESNGLGEFSRWGGGGGYEQIFGWCGVGVTSPSRENPDV